MELRVLGLLVFIGFFLFGCPSPPGKQLKDTGLFGQHELYSIDEVPFNKGAISGNFSGSFFLVIGSASGSIDGSYSSGLAYQFWWGPKKNEIIATTLPLRYFKFIIDKDKKERPTVEFVFDEHWLSDSAKTMYTDTAKEDLNSFIESENMKIVKIRISREQYEREFIHKKL